MAKVEIEMELGGFRIDSFKLRIKADREDLPRLKSEIGKQFSTFIQPPTDIIAEPARKQIVSAPIQETKVEDERPLARGKNTRRAKGATNGASIAPPVQWHHDPSKWGMPKQEWKAGQKVLWLLFVLKHEANKNELSSSEIADTFSTYFKQFGSLKKTSMPSILGALKKNDPTLIMDNVSKTPNTWYLSAEGEKAAEKIVKEARTQSA